MKKNIIYTVLIALVFFFSSSEVNAANLQEESLKNSCEKLISKGILDKKNDKLLFDGSGYAANCTYTKTVAIKSDDFNWDGLLDGFGGCEINF